MRQIVLHSGYPKTGTSSIEIFLRDNAEVLDSLGFHVPRIGQGRHGAHHALVSALAGRPLPPRQALSEAEIIRELSDAPADTVLISSERLTHMLANPQTARRLLGSLASTGAAIVVVMYVRNQTQRVNSEYSQQVKSFRYNGDFRTHVERALANGSCGYDKWIDTAHRHGFELRARPFSENVRRTGVVEDFLNAIGCPRSELFTIPPRVNEAAGPFTVEVARRLQGWSVERFEPLTLLQANHCKSFLLETVASMRIDEPRYCGLDDDLARQVEAASSESNDRFAQAVWGSDWAEVFQSDVGSRFEPNDYRLAGVPREMEEPLGAVYEAIRSEMTHILNRPRLAVREAWNLLRG